MTPPSLPRSLTLRGHSQGDKGAGMELWAASGGGVAAGSGIDPARSSSPTRSTFRAPPKDEEDRGKEDRAPAPPPAMPSASSLAPDASALPPAAPMMIASTSAMPPAPPLAPGTYVLPPVASATTTSTSAMPPTSPLTPGISVVLLARPTRCDFALLCPTASPQPQVGSDSAEEDSVRARLMLYPTIRNPILDYELLPRWVKCETRPFWRRMYSCRCTVGPSVCRNFALPYYGYLCRWCNLHQPGEPLPHCRCNCIGCFIPAEPAPETIWVNNGEAELLRLQRRISELEAELLRLQRRPMQWLEP
jgi:hypothetical protein